MISAVVQSLSFSSLLVLVFAGLLAASEVGRGLGARRAPAAGGRGGLHAAAAFGLLVLLVAVTSAMSVARYDARRAAVLEEAGALRAAARLAPMIPDDDGPAIVNDLRRTLDLALGLAMPSDPAKFEADVAETASVSSRMWEHLGVAVAAQPGSLPATRMAEALTRLDDAVERRAAALRDPLPFTIDALLIGTAAAAMALAGHAAAEADRRIGAAAMALLLSCAIAVTLDMQRPSGGMADVDATPLESLRVLLPPQP